MNIDDESRPTPSSFEVGGDVSVLSIDELEARINSLEQEIVRLREAINTKERSRNDAAAFFKT